METATITSKGQLTVPKAVREALGLGAGDRVEFVPMEQGGFAIRPLRSDISRIRGMLAGRVARPVSIDDMNEAIEEEAEDLDRR
jgi:AbrB family looped-hinge helix DNA binding protein